MKASITFDAASACCRTNVKSSPPKEPASAESASAVLIKPHNHAFGVRESLLVTHKCK